MTGRSKQAYMIVYESWGWVCLTKARYPYQAVDDVGDDVGLEYEYTYKVS